MNQIAQEGFEFHRIEHPQDRPVHLVGPGKVFVGRRNHRAMGVLEPVEPLFQPFHRDATQIDDIAAHRPFVCRYEGVHHVGIIQDDIGSGYDGLAQGVFYLGVAAHCALFVICRVHNMQSRSNLP